MDVFSSKTIIILVVVQLALHRAFKTLEIYSNNYLTERILLNYN